MIIWVVPIFYFLFFSIYFPCLGKEKVNCKKKFNFYLKKLILNFILHVPNLFYDLSSKTKPKKYHNCSAKFLPQDLRLDQEDAMKLYCDNKVAISNASNLVQHDKTKINKHFIKEKLEREIIIICYVNIFINGLSRQAFESIIGKLAMKISLTSLGVVWKVVVGSILHNCLIVELNKCVTISFLICILIAINFPCLRFDFRPLRYTCDIPLLVKYANHPFLKVFKSLLIMLTICSSRG